jgi:hypothetical protein
MPKTFAYREEQSVYELNEKRMMVAGSAIWIHVGAQTDCSIKSKYTRVEKEKRYEPHGNYQYEPSSIIEMERGVG